MTAINRSIALSEDEMESFRTQGFLGPFALCSPEEMAAMRTDIEAVLASDPPEHKRRVHKRQLDSRLI